MSTARTRTDPYFNVLTHPQGQAIFAILVLGAVILFSASFFLYSPYTGMEVYRDSSGEVDIVFLGGPAEQSGMKEGDLLVASDGRPLDPAHNAPRYRRVLVPGEVIVHTFQRGNQTLDPQTVIGGYRNNPSVRGFSGGIQILSAVL